MTGQIFDRARAVLVELIWYTQVRGVAREPEPPTHVLETRIDGDVTMPCLPCEVVVGKVFFLDAEKNVIVNPFVNGAETIVTENLNRCICKVAIGSRCGGSTES